MPGHLEADAGQPERRLEVAQPALRLLHVRLEQVDASRRTARAGARISSSLSARNFSTFAAERPCSSSRSSSR